MKEESKEFFANWKQQKHRIYPNEKCFSKTIQYKYDCILDLPAYAVNLERLLGDVVKPEIGQNKPTKNKITDFNSLSVQSIKT